MICKQTQIFDALLRLKVSFNDNNEIACLMVKPPNLYPLFVTDIL